MSTFTQILIHIVFAPYNREPVLWRNNRPDLFRYITGLVTNKHCKMLQINRMEDHLLLFTGLSSAIAIANLVKDIKLASSDWIKENRIFPKFRGWQDGYGAFSVSRSDRDRVIRYIQDQEAHHRRVTFLDEYWQLLQESGVEVDRGKIFR